jgi:hypothetical protein
MNAIVVAVSASLVTVAALAMAPPARAQSSDESRPRADRSARASFSVGASLGDGDTALALSASLDVPLSRRFAMDIELAYARKLDFTLDLCPAPLICVLGGWIPVTGRTVSLVPHLQIELLPPSSGTRAYALVGLGAGHVRQRYVFGPPLTGTLPEPVEFTRSRLTVALSYGGGITLPIWQRVSAGADVRLLHLFDQDPNPAWFIMPAGALSTVRIGARIGWDF